MNRLVLILIIVVFLAGGGYFAYKYFLPGKNTTVSPPGQNATQLCDTAKQTCNAVSPTATSASLKVTLSGNFSTKNLEVDLGSKPGAQSYYLKMTDDKGVALFEGVTPGSYFIYFNQGNFPAGATEPKPQEVQVVSGATKEVIINI